MDGSNIPLISIIIPVYNVEHCIEKCLKSIVKQTFDNFEAIFIDDGSPDKSGEICDEFAKYDSRIRVIHKENGGVGSARNAGLDEARGTWVVFVDSDDWCEADYLLDFVNLPVKLNDCDIVLQGRKDDVIGNVTYVLSLKNNTYQNIAEAMLENDLLTFGAPYCKLFSNAIIQKYNIRFPEEYSYGEDTIFFLRVMYFVSRVIITSKCNYHYVDATEGSLSKKDHDYNMLRMFLVDSMKLVKMIDSKYHVNGNLVKCYESGYLNLILRSVANMYRLRYSYERKIKCFNDIKKTLLPLIGSSYNITLLVLRYVPTCILVVLFNGIIKLRR